MGIDFGKTTTRQLIIFIKNALNTRDPNVVRVTLKILQVQITHPGGKPGANGRFSSQLQYTSRWYLWENDLRFALNSTPRWMT